jgi:hypothetical protein
VHERQVVIQALDDGAFRFVRPDGIAFDSPAPATGNWVALVTENESADIRIMPGTAVTGWTGEALDYDLAIGCLMERANLAKNVPAGTLPGSRVIPQAP